MDRQCMANHVQEQKDLINPHPSVFNRLKELSTYSKQRRYLKKFGLTKSEQRQILRLYKKWMLINHGIVVD